MRLLWTFVTVCGYRFVFEYTLPSVVVNLYMYKYTKTGQPRKVQQGSRVHVLVCARRSRLGLRVQGYLGPESQSPTGAVGGRHPARSPQLQPPQV